MTQTLLSVLALALLGLMVFNVLSQRNSDRVDRAERLVSEEARGLSLGLLEQAAALPFDDPAPGRTLPADFGPEPGAAVGGEMGAALAAGAFRDVDDLHSVANTARVYHQHPGLENPLVFDTTYEVEYVQATASGWQATGDTTAHKRLAVHMQHPSVHVRVALERVYSERAR